MAGKECHGKAGVNAFFVQITIQQGLILLLDSENNDNLEKCMHLPFFQKLSWTVPPLFWSEHREAQIQIQRLTFRSIYLKRDTLRT